MSGPRKWVGPIDVAFYNLGDGPDRAKERDLDHLRIVADVIALCEAGDRGQLLTRWAREHGWRIYFGDGSPGASSTPILFSPAVPVARAVTTEAVEAQKVGPAGAGPTVMKRKVTNRIRVARKGRPIDVHSAHLLPSATRANLPGDEEAKRRRVFREHIGALVAASRGRWAKKVCVGDFNAPAGHELLDGMTDAGYVALKTRPTHGKRQIDLAYVRRPWLHTQTAPDKAVALDGYSSDHRPIVATIY